MEAVRMGRKKPTTSRPTESPPPVSLQRVRFFFGRCLGIDGLDSGEHRLVLASALVLVGAAFAARLIFWIYTGRVWEDALITCLHSENLVRGLGMTHYLGEGEPPLHGFTSPLSVLVPLVGDLFKVGFGVSFIKIVSLFAGSFAVIYAMAIAIHPKTKLPAPLAVMVMAYLALEHHQILWGMAGMETQITTLVLLASLYYTIAEKPLALGISLGFCMLARPDFAFWTVIAGMYCLFSQPRKLPLIVGAALAVYLPWIVFTTLYYGSPVPNTIIAKGLGYPLWTTWPQFDRTPRFVFEKIWNSVAGTYNHSIFQALGPSFAGNSTGYKQVVNDHGIIANLMLVLASAGSAAALWRRQWAYLPASLFTLVYAVYYIFFVALVFGWYVSPFLAVVIFLSARGVQALGALLRRPLAVVIFFTAFAVGHVGSIAGVLPVTFAKEKDIQERVENQVRMQVGLCLEKMMKEDEVVGTEPAGYLAYYSGRIVYDWPGLCSRRVVEYSKTHPREKRSLLDMLEFYQPDFIVLRLLEFYSAMKRPWLNENYRIIASFEVPYEKDDPIFKDNWETGFVVFAKNTWQPGATKYKGERLGVNPNHCRALNYQGYQLMTLGRLEEAVDCFKKSIVVNSDFAESHANLGLALQRMGNAPGAFEQFQKAVALKPDHAVALNNLGVLLADRGDLMGAATRLREAVRHDPEYMEAHYNLADVLADLGNFSEARKHLEEALRIKPDSREATAALKRIKSVMGGR